MRSASRSESCAAGGHYNATGHVKSFTARGRTLGANCPSRRCEEKEALVVRAGGRSLPPRPLRLFVLENVLAVAVEAQDAVVGELAKDTGDDIRRHAE